MSLRECRFWGTEHLASRIDCGRGLEAPPEDAMWIIAMMEFFFGWIMETHGEAKGGATKSRYLTSCRAVERWMILRSEMSGGGEQGVHGNRLGSDRIASKPSYLSVLYCH